MRLPDFIVLNIEPILAEWEVFARSITPGAKMNRFALRDHAKDILRATALDMKSAQSDSERSDKSKGNADAGSASVRLTGASELHAVGRVDSGFDLMEMVSEYRALRASVIRLWRDSAPDADLRDIDDLTRFNEAIDQSLTDAVSSYTQRVDGSRRMFLAILGHDLRNPLNSVMISAQALSVGGELDSESASLASGIFASAQAMTRMIDDLLDFTGSGLGAAMPLSPTAMDVGALCAQVVDEMRAGHPTRMIFIERQGDLMGEWDAARLRQVLSNLLGNALQHGTATAPVHLLARGESSDVVLSVHNDGSPIPAEALQTIFDPLVRATADLKKPRRPGSIGLGLYIARAVARAHRGTLNVESSHDAGTVFTVRLPRHPAGTVRYGG